MDLLEWILLKVYALKEVVLFFLVPLFLVTLAGAIYLTRKASLERIERD